VKRIKGDTTVLGRRHCASFTGVSGGHGERYHQRDVASRVIERTIGAHGKRNFLVLDPPDRMKGDKAEELRV
jgi:hypothetical protein